MDEAIYEQLFAIEERHWWFRGRRAVIAALLSHAPSYSADGPFLDIGCGSGRNLLEFGGANATGVEFSGEAVALARSRGIACELADAQALPFEAQTFRTISAFDVVEHVQDDRAALAEARRVALPGASLVVTVPAYQWLWSQHDETHGHYRRYTRPRLIAVAHAAGWRTRFATYFNSILLPPIALVRAFRHGKAASTDYSLTGGPLDRVLALPLKAEAQLIRRGVRLPAGVSIGAVFDAV